MITFNDIAHYYIEKYKTGVNGRIIEMSFNHPSLIDRIEKLTIKFDFPYDSEFAWDNLEFTSKISTEGKFNITTTSDNELIFTNKHQK